VFHNSTQSVFATILFDKICQKREWNFAQLRREHNKYYKNNYLNQAPVALPDLDGDGGLVSPVSLNYRYDNSMRLSRTRASFDHDDDFVYCFSKKICRKFKGGINIVAIFFYFKYVKIDMIRYKSF
jgi:hypothetical protein